MANHKSAEKRARQNAIRNLRNKAVKTRMKNVVKKVRLAADTQSQEDAARSLIEAQAVIDQAAKKGVVHKRAAARKVSRLAKRVNSISAA